MRFIRQSHPLDWKAWIADRLHQEALPHPGRAQPEHVASLADEPASRQVEHLLPLDRRIEGPVELVQRLELAAQRRLDPPLQPAVRAHSQLVADDQLENSRWLRP
jgi:hypothetical protein